MPEWLLVAEHCTDLSASKGRRSRKRSQLRRR
uniref:Uncharacterized protein n=1 Tax=Anguilla anguilla TaxID=7936 RepID=A0A0E9VR96_ANGAN